MILKFSILLIFQLLIANESSEKLILPITRVPYITPLIPRAPTIPPTIKAINCTQLNTGKYRWVTFTGVPGGPSPFANGINSCYYFPNEYHLVSWHEARDFCQSIGGSLASIHNYTMNYLLSNRFNYGIDSYSTIYWIGLNSMLKRGIYKWSDNTPLDYWNYSTKTSNGDPIPRNVLDQGRCVSIKSMANSTQFYDRSSVGMWFREDCNLGHKFICERKIDNSIPPTVPPPKGNCPQDWYQYANQKCVKYINQSKNYNDSRAQCMALGGEVLSIHSDEEQNYIMALTADKPTPFIGYRKGNYYSSWGWDDQKKVDYTNFGLMNNIYTKPKYCIIFITNMTQPGKWITEECDRKLPVICEKPLDPNIQNPGLKFSTQKCTISGFDSNAVQYRNSCYSFVDSDPNNFVSFTDAENTCTTKGGHLASIVDPFEQSYLRYYLKENGKNDLYWIGLQSKNVENSQNVTEVFEWTDDWPVYYTYWDKYEPASAGLSLEGCVSIAKNNSLWRTSMCTLRRPFICKKSTKSLPNMNSDKTGVCPQLNNVNDKTSAWVNIDRRSPYCYWFSVDKKPLYNGLRSWSDASFICRKRNGTLASIHSDHELMLFRNKLNQTGTYYNTWIGLSKNPNGGFNWEDGTAVDYTNWDPNEKIVSRITDVSDDSDHQCVEIKSMDRMWRQQTCSGNKRNYFVCSARKVYSSSSSQKTKGLSGGAKAGIAFGVIIGLLVIGFVGFRAYKAYSPNSPGGSSFANMAYASKRGAPSSAPPKSEPSVNYERND